MKKKHDESELSREHILEVSIIKSAIKTAAGKIIVGLLLLIAAWIGGYFTSLYNTKRTLNSIQRSTDSVVVVNSNLMKANKNLLLSDSIKREQQKALIDSIGKFRSDFKYVDMNVTEIQNDITYLQTQYSIDIREIRNDIKSILLLQRTTGKLNDKIDINKSLITEN